MADETKDASTKPPRRKLQRLEIVQPPAEPMAPAAPGPVPTTPAPRVVTGQVPVRPAPTPEEKRALARRLAGLPEPEVVVGATPVASPPSRVVVPIHARPEDLPEWWRNHVGALLLVKDIEGSNQPPTEIRLESVSPSGDYLRCRPTGGAFMWRPRAVIKLLDVIAYPEDIHAYEQAWRRLYGQDAEAVDQKLKDLVHSTLAEYGIVQPA